MAALDGAVAQGLRGHDSPIGRRLLRALSDLHRPRGIVLALALLVAALWLWRRDRAAALTGLCVVLGGAWLNHGLKQALARPRPGADPASAMLTDFAFPSGHAANATLLYGALVWLLVWRQFPGVPRLPSALAGAAAVLLVALSRLVLGAHHLSDVIAGMLVGLGWLVLCVIGFSWAKAGRALRT